jgi:hypothetical protein
MENIIHEKQGIEFLRSLINSEPGNLSDGRADPGWCCFEHSLVASLAFCIAGVKAFRCSGKLVIGDFREKLFMDVMPHSFVFIDKPRLGIFDSSVTFNSIEGIPMRFSSLIPDLGVGLLNEKPTGEHWKREGTLAGKTLYALYGIQKKMIPDEKHIAWTSNTPFGTWLTKTFGSQKGLWSKAAWCAAQVYTGQPIFDFKGIEKAQLWDLVATTADKDDFVVSRIKSIR